MPKKTAKKFQITRFLFVLIFWGMIGGVGLFGYYLITLPDFDQLKGIPDRPSFTFYDRQDNIILRYGTVQGDVIPVRQLPDHLVYAVLSIEDRRFYDHFGIDPIGLGRAMIANAKAGRIVQGGSTITQQLAKNLFLTPERTISRKIREAMAAIWLELKFTKDEILSAYLNRVYFGSGAYGIDAASQIYFDRSARDLTPVQSALIAGLLKAPSRYSPLVNPDLSIKRRNTVIHAMEDADYITPAQKQDYLGSVLNLSGSSRFGDNIRYFIDWILAEMEGYLGPVSQDVHIYTTLDSNLQSILQLSVKNAMERFGQNGPQMAGLYMAPDGRVRAMLGGRDYGTSQFNRAVQANRQPGSAFKPIVYLAALKNGYDPNDQILDAPLTIDDYSLTNFTDEYNGSVRLTTALAQSLNTATVRLANDIGLDAVIDTARQLGLSQDLRRDLSIALGSSEVSVMALTSVYVSIANGGYAVWPYGIRQIRDRKNNLLFQQTNHRPPRVIAPRPYRQINAMLRAVIEQGTGRNAAIPNRLVMGKTGTSQDFRDAWFIGYTPDIIGGIWMGYDDNRPMKMGKNAQPTDRINTGITGGDIPAKTWASVVRTGYQDNVINRPDPIKRSRSGRSFGDMLNRLTGGSGRSTDAVDPTYDFNR